MMTLTRFARAFYGLGIAGMGIQQFIYSEFRPVFISSWPPSISNHSAWAYIVGGALIVAGLFIAVGKNARIISFALALLFLALFLFFHLPDQVKELQNLRSIDLAAILGPWINPLKELALSGGAFIIAASYAKGRLNTTDSILLTTGRIFFSVMLITFGISHFVYTKFVVTIVPGWIPFPLFWTYFGAIALIGAGLCILSTIKIRLVSLLLGLMLFLWFVMLHIPRAIKYPDEAKGNELTSVFQALAFSGVAFTLAYIYRNRISGVSK